MGIWFSFLVIGIGAALGAWLRWGFNVWFNPLLSQLPLGTLAANLVGGLLMGIMIALINRYPSFSPELRLALVTGFLGGLTTFSTFSGETVSLFLNREFIWGTLNVIGHVAGSLLMTLAGIAGAGWIFRNF